MRHYWIIGLAMLAYNALLLVGVWHLEWSLGVIVLLLLVEACLASLMMGVELTRAGARTGHRVRAVVVAGTNMLVLLAATGLTAVLGAYYTWLFGIELSWAVVLLPVAVLVARYVVEVLVRWFAVEVGRPSQAMQRGWIRVLSIALLVAISGIPLMVALMSSLPFELPRPPMDFLFSPEPYADGLLALVEREIGAISLSIIVVVKCGFELHSVWGRNRAWLGQWGWVDRVFGMGPAPRPLQDDLL